MKKLLKGGQTQYRDYFWNVAVMLDEYLYTRVSLLNDMVL